VNMKYLVFAFVALMLFMAESSLPSIKQDSVTLFKEFCTHWNKTYSAEEKIARYQIFEENARKIPHLNALNRGAVFGLTKFADMTHEEFVEKIVPSIIKPKRQPPVMVKSSNQIPSVPIDWTKKGMVTPIKNQGQCGSSFAIGVVETVESANMVLGRKMTRGSVDEVVTCTGNSSCDGGDPIQAFKWVVSEGGLESEECYGPIQPGGGCQSANCPVNPDPNLILKGTKSVAATDSDLYTALSSAPVFVCVDAESWQLYAGGILQASQCGTDIDHCVQLTGYSPTQGGYWILKNSWGADWGMNGYIYLQYGQNTCAITELAVLGVAK